MKLPRFSAGNFFQAKKKFLIAAAVLLFIFPAFPVCASESDEPSFIDSITEDFRGVIPDSAEKQLPEDIFDGGQFDGLYLIRAAAHAAEATVLPALKTLGAVCALLLPCAAVCHLSENTLDRSCADCLTLITSACTVLSLSGTVTALVNDVGESIGQLNVFMSAMLPILSSLYSLGGNVMTAAAGSASLMALFTLIEAVTGYFLFPLLRLTYSTALLTSFDESGRLAGLGKLIRTVFTTVIALLMTLFSFIMAYQQKLTLSADSAAARTVKFAAANLIPVIGSSIGEAMRALLGSFSYLKNTIGVISVIVIVLLALPILIRLLAFRLVLSVCAVFSDIIGVPRSSAVLRELNGLLGFALAVLILCAVMFIFNFTLLISSAAALSV